MKKYSKFKNNQGGRITLALDEANDWTWNGKIWFEIRQLNVNGIKFNFNFQQV